MSEQTLSVIVHGWRPRSAIVSTLDSILNQTVPTPLEVVALADSASSNQTDVVTNSYSGAVRFITSRQPRPRSLNGAVHHASGRFVAVVAAGTIWPAEYAKEQLAFLEQHHDVSVVAAQQSRTGAAAARAMTVRSLLEESPVIDLSNAIMRRAAVVAAGVFDEGIRQAYDIDLWLRLAIRGDAIIARELPLLITPQRAIPSRHDYMHELESLVSVLERFGHRYLLDAPTRTALRVRVMRLIDRLEIEQARCRLDEGLFDAARFHLACARKPSWRVRVALVALRLAPRLAAAVHRRIPAFSGFL